MNEKILMGGPDLPLVWTADNLRAAGLSGEVRTKENILSSPEQYRNTRYLFSTWGMPAFREDEIRRCLPSLRAVFYAAGSVQSFAAPFLDAGVAVFSAQAANAVPVAEYTVAQILLANKGYFCACRSLHTGTDWNAARALSNRCAGNYGATVGIVGCGMIGRMVAERLRSYRLRVLVYDAFLPEEAIHELGAEKVTLEELFAASDAVSNHLANVPATVGMLNGKLFASMKPYATFLNTGRGATVREDELIAVLTARPDLCALLDVVDPEPPAPDSPLLTLPNVFLTPHISGSQQTECARMGAYMAEEFRAFDEGKKTRFAVTREMLATMA